MKWEDMVYESMMGEQAVPGVENAFAKGSRCAKLYEEIYQANCRICDRLGLEEDPDVEMIMNSFMELNRELCLRMYRLGRGGE